MTEPVLDVRSAVRAIVRRRIVVAGLVLEGIAGAVIFVILQTPSFVAHSRVVLPPAPGMDESGAPLRDIGTELFVATNEEILERAGQVLRPPVGADELRRRVRTRAASSDVIEIRMTAGSSEEAAVLADAVANEYVAYANSARSAEAEATISELEKQEAQLEERIRDLETRISDATASAARLDPTSPEAARAGVLLATLRSEQVDGEQRLNAVNTRIDDIHLNALLTRRGARVLEKASPPDGPARPRPVRDVTAGGLVGLLAGVVLALAVDQRDRTLRLRRDIAEAVKAPVLASVRVPRRRRRNRFKALLKQWVPSAAETRLLEQAIAYAGTSEGRPPANLAVASLAGDRRASMVSLQLAVVAAESGTRTAVVIDGAVTTHLGSSCDRLIRRKGEVRPRLRVLRASAAQSPAPKPGELIVVPVAVAVAVDETIPVPFPPFLEGAPVVLAVSSGFATADKLAAAAAACIDAGHPLVGVVVANPERGDRTRGRLSSAARITENGGGAARSAWQAHPPPSLKSGGGWG